jgi:hypothetical protein
VVTARRRLTRRLFSGRSANWLNAFVAVVALAFAYTSQEARAEADAARIHAEYELLREQDKSAMFHLRIEGRILDLRQRGNFSERHEEPLRIG